ncbi:ROK family transcriptional regulator [Anaerolentibacter hominis]|uniref:ROK family transcriptional regulator n=1 Tax=Anaerolentibacter hominis TaxID=3079009 RepID=UPI0031B833BB
MINDVVDLKNKNAKIVMDLIRFSDSLTKKDIAKQSALSITTVSTICSDLKSLGIISEQRTANSRVGRIPNSISFHYDAFFVIGIDLQVANTLGLAIINLHNEIIFSKTYDISDIQEVEDIAVYAKEQLDEQIQERELNPSHFIGAGISVPAIFDAVDSCLISSSIEKYNGVNMKQVFQSVFHIPIYVDNSSNFKAISAHTTSKVSNIVCLDISQGTGVGIICNDALLRGKNGYGAEVAHVPIGDKTLRCPSCGSYGCIEAELQVEHILQHYPHYDAGRNADSQWSSFVEYVNQHPDDFRPLLQKIGYLVGSLTSILVNIFDPSMFLITGYIADLFPLIRTEFMEQVQKRCSLSLARGLTFQVENYHSSSIYEGICDTIYDNWLPLDNIERQ